MLPGMFVWKKLCWPGKTRQAIQPFSCFSPDEGPPPGRSEKPEPYSSIFPDASWCQDNPGTRLPEAPVPAPGKWRRLLPPFGISFTRVTGRTRCAFSASRDTFSRREAAEAPPSTKSNTRPLESRKTTEGSMRTPCIAARDRLPSSSQSFTEGCLGTVTNCTSRTYSSSARRSSVPGWRAFNQRASAEPGSSEPYTTRTGREPQNRRRKGHPFPHVPETPAPKTQ